MIPICVLLEVPLYIEISISNSLNDLKQILFNEEGLRPDSFDILYEGEKLCDNRSIAEQGVAAEAELEIKTKRKWRAQARLRSAGMSFGEVDFSNIIKSSDSDELLVHDFVEIWSREHDFHVINKMLLLSTINSDGLKYFLSHKSIRLYIEREDSIREKILIEAVRHNNLQAIISLVESKIMKRSDFNAKSNGIPILMLTSVPQITKIILENGASVDCTDRLSRTPLISSCKKGELDVVKELLFYKPNLSIKDSTSRTAVMEACSSISDDNINILLLLLEYLLQTSSDSKPDPAYVRSIINTKSSNGTTPLMEACKNESGCHIDIVRLLFCSNTYVSESVHKHDKYGRTSLMHACRNTSEGSYGVVQILLANNASLSLDFKDIDGRNSLIHCCININEDNSGCGSVAEEILKHTSDVSVHDNFQRTALHYAVRSTSSAAVALTKELISRFNNLNNSDNFSRTPLLDACDNRGQYSTNLIEVLISKCVSQDVNFISNNGRSPLMEICRNPVFPQNVDNLKILLPHVPNVSLVDSSFQTAIQYAAENVRDGGELLAQLELVCPQEIIKSKLTKSKVKILPIEDVRVRSWVRKSSKWWARAKKPRAQATTDY